MDITYFEKIEPSNVINIIFIILGIAELGVGISILLYQTYQEKEIEWKIIALEIICGIILLSLNWHPAFNSKEEKYIYARIDKTVPYIEMVEKYDFIEKSDNIYKLREKPQ